MKQLMARKERIEGEQVENSRTTGDKQSEEEEGSRMEWVKYTKYKSAEENEKMRESKRLNDRKSEE